MKISLVALLLLAAIIVVVLKLSRRVGVRNKKKNAGALFLAAVTLCVLFCAEYAFSRAQYLILLSLAMALAAISSALVYRRST
jgi:hypothetical protein